jgi:L-threonylcarbamoyladenylate synthase
LAGDGSVGIRVTEDKFCSDLIYRLRVPIVSSSANISGQPAPAVYTEIDEAIKQSVDYIVPLRQDETEKTSASSIIKLETDGRFKILR